MIRHPAGVPVFELGGSALLRLPASDIALDGPWLFCVAQPDAALLASLAELGQLTPVLVASADAGCKQPYRLVAGRKRVLALQELGREVLAVPLSGGPLDFGLASLASNQGRAFNLAHRLAAFRFFSPLLDSSALSERVLPLLGLTPGTRPARQLLRWLDVFPFPGTWDAHCAAGRLPLEVIDLLARFAPTELDALEPFFMSLSWSLGSAREFLTCLFETSRRQEEGVDVLIRSAGLEELLALELSPRDCIARLLARARELRYPELTRRRQAFVSLVAGLGRSRCWRVEQDGEFERSAVLLRALVRNRAELDQAAEELEQLRLSDGWENIWATAGGELPEQS